MSASSEAPASAQPTVPPQWWRLGLTPRFWTLLVPIGLVAGLLATGLKELLRAVQHVAWSYPAGAFTDAVGKSGDVRRVAVLAAAGVLAGVSWWLLERVAGTRGGDLSDAVWSGEGRMALVPTAVTATISETVIGLGASLGREAPPKEASAAVASWLAGRAGLSTEERRLLVACAAGAGFAAIYNIPFGGAIFAVEVLLGSLTLPLVVPVLGASWIATAISWTVLPDRPYYPSLPTYPASVPLVVWALVAGPVLGLGAAAFVWLVGRAQNHKASGRWLLVTLPVGFAALGAIAIAYPQLLGNGRDAAEEVFLGGYGLPALAALMALKPLVTSLCLGSGASGGLFTPTTSYGALAGALLGSLWSVAWPGAPGGAYALVGATAMLGAAMNGPVSAVVLMIELTHHLTSLLVPSLAAVVGATLVTRALGSRSIYSARLPAHERPDRWAASDRWRGTAGSPGGAWPSLRASLDRHRRLPPERSAEPS